MKKEDLIRKAKIMNERVATKTETKMKRTIKYKVKIMNERYQLLSKEVKYIIKFVSNWEVFDFDNLQKSLDEMKELQQKLKQK